MEFSEISVNGIPLLVLIVGLVQFLKTMGLDGKLLRGASALLGVVAGLLYEISLGVPVDFAGWFGAVIFGLALGITASGLVDVARDLAKRSSPGAEG